MEGLTAWLAANAWRLEGVRPGGPVEDLRAFGAALDGVRVVGLGEATHGTSEFFRLKHRLLEFLVVEAGFTALAMEASVAASRAVDDYVRGGDGDAAALVAGLGFWTWRTEEVLALVEWMRSHNRRVAPERHVRFVGIDAQHSGDAVERLAGFLRVVAPEEADGRRAAFDVLREARPGSRPDPAGALRAEMERLVDAVEGRRAEFAERVGEGAVAEAVEDVRLLVHSADLISRLFDPADTEGGVFTARERYMAEAVDALVDGSPSRRVVVWAHNGHVASGLCAGVPALGARLRERYGDAYYALALLLGEGSFRARRGADVRRPVRRNRIGRPGAHTLEGLLARAVPVDHLVDLRAAGEADAEVREALRQTYAHRTFGAAVPRFLYRLNAAPVVPAEEFDGLAYVARSTCSRPLP
ncbi:erythromycin esterase family protein [Streptomyces alkaliterrae]|uniref:erythromycin esterase family protein n=1 Tax=Streptomyces alkaliterrae TaxID=2213162 RepID=UPI002B202017|nr:erythromycin esterase family protein [Streptomyces alkaliterrae]